LRPSSAALCAALLAGCGGGIQPAGVGGSATLVTPDRVATYFVPDRGASWMTRDAASAKSLLYVSDAGTFDVDVYTFPGLTPAGKLTGFVEPQGECSGKNGEVWITNTVSQQILEFAHGGKHAIRTLTDPTGYPGGCAVDASTGDVAVTNIFNSSGGGEVLIYRGGRGTPAPYFNPAVTYYYFDGYDSSGNLYVSGATSGGSYVLSFLRRGRRSMESFPLHGGTIHFAGSVQWLGKTLALGDQECDGKKSACFYEVSVSRTSAKIIGKTTLTGSCDVAQGWIEGGRLAAGNFDNCGGDRSGAYLWKYPGGGASIRGVRGLTRPIGATISTR
jgi:hypothetical protein